jgi:protein-tyrosine phosphatase
MLRVLTVCTANVCRSPMAAALLDRQCTQRGIDVLVTSAGTHATGASVEAAMLEAMAQRGIDLSTHQPRLLVAEMVATEGADLVVAMTREHLRAVAIMVRGSIARTFTAKELARRVDATDFDAGTVATPSIANWLSVAGAGRSIRQLLGDDPADDVADPYQMPLSRHIQTANEIDALMAVIAGSLARWLDGNEI